MKRLPLVLPMILLFMGCQKQISPTDLKEEIASVSSDKKEKTKLCHYDVLTGVSRTIEVTGNALAAHLAHNDLEGDCSEVLVSICDQDWMAKNLNTEHYRNGDPITQAQTPQEWIDAGTNGIGAWCYYNSNSSNGPIYGKLYNWYAVNDPRGLAPNGWHIPTFQEWNTLINVCLGGTEVAGGKMKATGILQFGTGLWLYPNTDATNISGFTGLPAGYRYDVGSFLTLNYYTDFWSDTEQTAYDAWYCYLYSSDAAARLYYYPKATGMSVRCVRD